MGCIFWTSQLPNVLRAEALGVFWLLNVLRATAARFFNISASKSAPNLKFAVWLLNVLRATVAHTFSHLNFQKCSDNEVSLASSLQNLLRTTTACNFSSLILPDGSAPAALASLLFDPPEPQTLEKHSVSRLFYLFAHLHLLSSDSFSSLIFFLLPFSSLFLFSDFLSSSFLFSDSSHLCFSICPYQRKFEF